MGASLAFAAALVSLLTWSRDARALDAFEIQVYDGTADAAGGVGLELHVNDVVSGAKTAAPTELPPNHQLHLTLEPSYGVTSWWELGAYVQTALRADETYDFAGVKLRSKLVTPPTLWARARLGLNVEVSDVPARYEAERWGLELRPIAAWDSGHVALAVNPIVGVSLTGGGATFEPAASALFVLPGRASFGLEYYAELGPLASWSRARDEAHVLYEVVNLLAVRGLEVNAGVGEGLTPASNAFVAKVIVGYTWERLTAR